MKTLLTVLITALIFFPIIYFYIWHKNTIKKYKEEGDVSKCPYLNNNLNKK